MNKVEPQNRPAISTSLAALRERARTRASLSHSTRSRTDSVSERSQRRLSILSSLNGFIDDDDKPSFPLDDLVLVPGKPRRSYERRRASTNFSLDKINSPTSRGSSIPVSISVPPQVENEASTAKNSGDKGAANRRFHRRGSVTRYSLGKVISPENSEEFQRAEPSIAPASLEVSAPIHSSSQPTIDERPLPMKKRRSKKGTKKKSRRNSSIKTKKREESPLKAPPSPGLFRRRNSVTRYSASMIASAPPAPEVRPPASSSLSGTTISVLGDGIEYDAPLNDM